MKDYQKSEKKNCVTKSEAHWLWYYFADELNNTMPYLHVYILVAAIGIIKHVHH